MGMCMVSVCNMPTYDYNVYNKTDKHLYYYELTLTKPYIF